MGGARSMRAVWKAPDHPLQHWGMDKQRREKKMGQATFLAVSVDTLVFGAW